MNEVKSRYTRNRIQKRVENMNYFTHEGVS